MTSVPIPASLGARARKGWFIKSLPIALAAALLAVMAAKLAMPGSASPLPGLVLHAVTQMDLDVKVVKDGELHAVNSIDLLSGVEGSNTIQYLIEEGTFARKGDVLVKLDSSTIEQRIDDVTLDVQRAESDLATSRETKAIQESQNAANLESAEVGLMLARLDLEQYTEGNYPQQLVQAQTDLDNARTVLKNKQEEMEQTNKLYERGFVTMADVKKGELDLRNANNALRRAKTAIDVLTEYTYPMTLATKKNAVVQAEARLERVKRENVSSMTQREADLRSRQQGLNLQKRRLDKLKEQLAACTIVAPADGLVVYASTTNRNSPQIQEGSQVRERQLLLTLPDTTSMKAVVRIPEAQVSKLRPGQRATVKIIGHPQPIEATLERISVLADSSQRYHNPDLKEYPVDLVLDQTPAGLKPGRGVQAEVFVNRLQDVTAVPVPAVYAMGADNYVFIRQGETIHPVKVRLGQSSETHVEVVDGINPGQQVVLLQVGQGRELLERAGIRPQPATRPATEP